MRTRVHSESRRARASGTPEEPTALPGRPCTRSSTTTCPRVSAVLGTDLTPQPARAPTRFRTVRQQHLRSESSPRSGTRWSRPAPPSPRRVCKALGPALEAPSIPLLREPSCRAQVEGSSSLQMTLSTVGGSRSRWITGRGEATYRSQSFFVILRLEVKTGKVPERVAPSTEGPTTGAAQSRRLQLPTPSAGPRSALRSPPGQLLLRLLRRGGGTDPRSSCSF